MLRGGDRCGGVQVASSDLVHRFEAAQRAADTLMTGYVTDADVVARELLEVLATPAVLYRCAAHAHAADCSGSFCSRQQLGNLPSRFPLSWCSSDSGCCCLPAYQVLVSGASAATCLSG